MALKAFTLSVLHGDGARACRLRGSCMPLCVADDEVIEEPDVESVCCVAKAQREPCVIGTRCGIAARMVVDDDQ